MPSKKDLISSPLNILPKKMNKKEADLTLKVVNKLKKYHPHRNWALEVKYGNNKLEEHQKKALKQVENGKFGYKIPDMGRRNPLDYIFLGDADAIVCTISDNNKDVICDINNGTYERKFRL